MMGPRPSAILSARVADAAIREADKRERLRDEFAIAALQGMLAAGLGPNHDQKDEWSQVAYAWADAMLKARGKR